MTAPREITWDDLEPLAIGCGILGTGGGGDPYIALLNAQKLWRQGRRFRLIDPFDLDDDDLAAEAAFMGAPLVGQERLESPEFCARSVRAMERHMGRPFTAVMSGEIGGANGVIPLLVAGVMDLPIVDADTMGRAFPEMQMSSFVIGGISMCPLTMSDIRDNEVVITETADPVWVERISRVICTEMGSTASTCCAARSGRQIKDHGITGTLSQAINLGRAVRRAHADHEDPIAAVLAAAKNLAAAGAQVVDVDLPPSFAELVERQKEVMAQNAARDLAFEYHNHRDRLSRHIIALIEQGLAVSYPDYQAALSAAALARQSLTEIFSTVDVLLCPSATGQAPKRGNGTGDPVFNRMWTLLGNPCVNLPGHRGATDLPVGVQAVGAMGRDEVLLSHCRWMERRIV